MNVTLVPEHIVVVLAVILTLAGIVEFTVIVIVLDVAGDPVKHGVALLVITTVIASLLVIVVEVYVALLVPTLLPFTFHW